MFKLGLYSQARVDFEMLCTKYPKELEPKFNLALILLQLGEFTLSIKCINDLIEESQRSPECKSLFNRTDSPDLGEDEIGVLQMMQNAYLLMARCHWRTGSALRAVKCYNQSQRYSHTRSEKAKDLTSEELLLLIRNQVFKDIKFDIRLSTQMYKRVRANSYEAKTRKLGEGSAAGEHSFDSEEEEDFVRRAVTQDPRASIFGTHKPRAGETYLQAAAREAELPKQGRKNDHLLTLQDFSPKLSDRESSLTPDREHRASVGDARSSTGAFQRISSIGVSKKGRGRARDEEANKQNIFTLK